MTHGMRYAIHNGRFAASTTIAELKIQIKNRAKKNHNIIQTTVVALGRHVSPLKLFYDVKFEWN